MSLEVLDRELRDINVFDFSVECAKVANGPALRATAFHELKILQSYKSLNYLSELALHYGGVADEKSSDRIYYAEGMLNTCLALTSSATSARLKEELRQTEPEHLGRAFVLVLRKQDNLDEANDLINDLHERYPALYRAGVIMKNQGERFGANALQTIRLISGSLAAGLALKILIDQYNFNSAINPG